MAEAKPRRSKGSRPKDPSQLRSSSATFRLKEQLRQDLEASARYHGRTLSEEIAYRLERSFVEGRALENMSQELGYWWREQGATDEQVKEWLGSLSNDSPDVLATRGQSRGFFAKLTTAGVASPAPQADLEETMYRAVLRALREARATDPTQDA